MQSDSALDIAVARGIISKSQANSIRLIEGEEGSGLSSRPDQLTVTENDDEGFRFITGFSDIFIALGVIIFLSGILRTSLLESVPGTLVIAAVCWGLSEIVATWQRRSLPSMVSAAGFVFFTAVAVFSWFHDFNPSQFVSGYERLLGEPDVSVWLLPLTVFASSLVYYVRFKLPFSLFLSAISFASTMLAGLFFSLEESQIADVIIPALFATGLIIVCAALYFDTRDPDRRTRFSDNAFWLQDYALYTVLKTRHQEKAWTQWTPQLALRETSALEQARQKVEKKKRRKQKASDWSGFTTGYYGSNSEGRSGVEFNELRKKKLKLECTKLELDLEKMPLECAKLELEIQQLQRELLSQ